MDDLYAKLSRYVRDHEAQGNGTPDDPPPAVDWKAELLRDFTAEPARRPYHGASVPAAGGRTLDERLLPPAPAGFDPATVPRDFNTYRALVHRVFDPPKKRLIARLVRQPIVRGAFEVWQPGAVRANLNVTYEVFDVISKAMGEVYRFRPANMGYRQEMDGMWGYYVEDTREVYFAEVLLHQPAREMIATIIHEQIHKLQGEMVWRLERPGLAPLSHPERALALYWLREDRVIRQLYARALAEIAAGRGDALYRRIGKEYHAFDTEDDVVPVLEREFG